jgi:hypothetical protein
VPELADLATVEHLNVYVTLASPTSTTMRALFADFFFAQAVFAAAAAAAFAWARAESAGTFAVPVAVEDAAVADDAGNATTHVSAKRQTMQLARCFRASNMRPPSAVAN